ncbi:hypothetical protein Ddye_025786 [Dipteronia dyeriana]|uniref:Importin subunit alpha n=1 Tax=Dipteronia dyeriana TaxID=168575 RepID=A0AAD9TL14_9ROSI|nr:hypothetical protein Ddye_025786 [Dipteronia dyeriana]
MVAVDADEGQRISIEIRKSKILESSKKKRRKGRRQQHQLSASAQVSSITELEQLLAKLAGISSDDVNLLLEATTQLRKLLSIECIPPIAEVILARIVCHFVCVLRRFDCPRFQAMWALVNVAGDSPKCRDLVLGCGAMLSLLPLLNDHAKLPMLRNAMWTVSNFFGESHNHLFACFFICRLVVVEVFLDVHSLYFFKQIKHALPAIARLILLDDEEVLTDSCWALSYLSDGTYDKIQAVIDAGVCPRLVELLTHRSPSVLISALRTVGNIVTGDDLQSQCIINHQALPCLLNLLISNYKKSIKKEACWRGNKEQIHAVIEANIIGPLIHLLQNAEFDIKKEAAWAISNATSGGTHEQINYSLFRRALEVDKCLGNTGGVNVYAQMIDDAEGLEKIENLQSHDNTEIYEEAVKILETYWKDKRRWC